MKWLTELCKKKDKIRDGKANILADMLVNTAKVSTLTPYVALSDEVMRAGMVIIWV